MSLVVQAPRSITSLASTSVPTLRQQWQQQQQKTVSCSMSSQADNAAPVYNMFSGLPVPGGVSEQLWDDCQQEAQESLQHPFVLALAQGTLDR